MPFRFAAVLRDGPWDGFHTTVLIPHDEIEVTASLSQRKNVLGRKSQGRYVFTGITEADGTIVYRYDKE
jgi:hypothetical protein